MKNQLFVIALIVIAMACSTTDSREVSTDLDQMVVAEILNPQVGDRISSIEAKRWKNNYKNIHSISHTFYVESGVVNGLLGINLGEDQVDGLNFTKGMINAQEEVLIVAPVSKGMSVFTIENTLPGRQDNETLYLLSNEGNAVTLAYDDAKKLATKYQSVNAISEANPKSYFIGREILLEMLNIKNDGMAVDGLRLMKTVKDSQEEALVLVPTQGNLDLWQSRSRKSSEMEDSTFDFSAPCPNTCPCSSIEL